MISTSRTHAANIHPRPLVEHTMPFRLLCALIPVLSVAPIAVAQNSPAAAAQRFLERKHEEVERVLRRPAGEQRNRRLGALLGELLDYDELTRRTLARHWEERTEEERAEFGGVLRRLIERSYRGNLERTLTYETRYENAVADGDDVVVTTTARNRENRREPEVQVQYHLHQVNGQWRVYDVAADGASSLVTNWRRQVHRLITRKSWEDLLSRMRARLDEG